MAAISPSASTPSAGTLPSSQLLPQRHARAIDRGARVGGAPRAAGARAGRIVRAPELDPHALERQRRAPRPRPGPRSCRCRCRCRSCPSWTTAIPSGAHPHRRLARHLELHADRGRHAVADQPAAVAQARRAASGRRSQPNRRAPSRMHSTSRRSLKGTPRLGMDRRARSGSAARPGPCSSASASSSIADSTASRPGASPGARTSSPRGRSSVDQPVPRQPVGRGVQRPRRGRASARRTPRAGSCAWSRRGRAATSRPSRAGAQPDPLARRRAHAEELEDLLPGHHDLDRLLQLRGRRAPPGSSRRGCRAWSRIRRRRTGRRCGSAPGRSGACWRSRCAPRRRSAR